MAQLVKIWARALAGLLLVGGPLVLVLQPAGAATVVSSEAALRAAYGNAATTAISLSANITLTNCGLGRLTRNSAASVTVQGNGHTLRQTCADALFEQNGAGALTLSRLVNVAALDQDGVSAAGAVTLVDSTMSNVGAGAGVSNGTSTTLIRSAITGVDDDGEGVTSGTSVSLTKSHIDGATGVTCEGISNGTTVTLVDSTVSGCSDAVTNGTNVSVTNSTIVNAGDNGIISGGVVTLSFATIVHNGIGVHAPTLKSFASVVAKSTVTDCVAPAHTSSGYNFDGDGTCHFNLATDHSHAGDPHLGSLANNGGTTRTLLPQSNSPLVNKIPVSKCNQAADERGVARPQTGLCDIGAVEAGTAQGYRLVEANGGLANFGNAPGHGSLPSAGITPASPIVDVDRGLNGYRMAGADGAVFAFGTSTSQGSLPSLGIHPTKPIVDIAARNSSGYWLVGADGGVFGFGSGVFQGSLPSLGIHPAQPIVGMTPTANGGGYWLVGADGGVFAIGNAAYHGSLPSLGVHPSAPIVGIAATTSGGGYWLAGADGHIYKIGNAPVLGSVTNPSGLVTGIAATPGAGGYWLATKTGHVYNFGNATALGSLANPSKPVVGIASTG